MKLDSPILEKIEEAINFLQKNEPSEGYLLAFSGGKDSVVLRWITEQAGVKFQAFYNITTIDPPEVRRFVRRHYPDTVEVRPKLSFWRLIEKKKCLPFKQMRFCCYYLKENNRFTENRTVLIGNREEESPKRKKQSRIRQVHGRVLLEPIRYFSTEEIWEIIEENNLPYLSIYENRKCARVGCVLCPYQTYKNKLLSMVEYPRFWKTLRIVWRRIWKTISEKRKERYHQYGIVSPDDYIDWWVTGLSMKKFSAMRRQKALFPSEKSV